MLVGAGRARRAWVPAALLTALLAGCSGGADGDAKEAASASAATDKTGAAKAGTDDAKSGGSIGADGSACELPISFDIAEDWKAEAIDVGPGKDPSGGTDDELSDELADALMNQGPVTAACEVDAKPAGHVGFLRVWTGDPGGDDARAVLEAFLAAEDGVSKAKYGTFTSGGLSGAEVEYLYTSKLLEETKKERALAVDTPSGPVVVHLGGLDSEEHEAMLPAYELAKKTLRLT